MKKWFTAKFLDNPYGIRMFVLLLLVAGMIDWLFEGLFGIATMVGPGLLYGWWLGNRNGARLGTRRAHVLWADLLHRTRPEFLASWWQRDEDLGRQIRAVAASHEDDDDARSRIDAIRDAAIWN